jgi:hypothetical protein
MAIDQVNIHFYGVRIVRFALAAFLFHGVKEYLESLLDRLTLLMSAMPT